MEFSGTVVAFDTHACIIKLNICAKLQLSNSKLSLTKNYQNLQKKKKNLSSFEKLYKNVSNFYGYLVAGIFIISEIIKKYKFYFIIPLHMGQTWEYLIIIWGKL